MPFHLDSILLRSFVAIADTGSFSKAAAIVGRTQSALSLQIKKLEESLGCKLFDRGARKATLTEQGEVFSSYARRITALQLEVYSRLKEPEAEGEIRFGTPEDFATHYLPDVLALFRKQHPRIQLNVDCDLTLNLLDGFQQEKYDLILVKRDPQRVRGGTRVWREPLVWAGVTGWQAQKPLSLVLSPQPCIYRSRALAALDRAKIPWRVAYTSPSLAGTLAAVKAGLGVTVLPQNMLPTGVHPIRNEIKLPELADAEIALIKREDISSAGEILAEHIIHSLETVAR